ncbi:hypothetical protein HGRIS_003887 [Hohenbuehelia grisea]|uniref:Cullin family profile domain-containing protein n=1 Tax=Hohenbuehelia grisea TaxID=104357 RepID=A0ABR3JH46_9AGAR
MASGLRSTRGRGKTIKAPKRHGPEVSVDATWTQLSQNLKEVLNNNAEKLSFEENHRFAYNLVLWKSGALLYKGVMELVVANLAKLAHEDVTPSFPTGAASDPVHQSHEAEMLLKALRRIWDDHTGNMTKLSQLLSYMDRIYTKSADVPQTREAGLKLFFEHILRPPSAIQEHVIAAILSQIQSERDGYVINRSALKECVDVFLSLETEKDGPSAYERDLEPAILKESQKFYASEGEKLIDSCDAPEYLRRVEARFTSEEDRTHHYLSPHSHPPLRKILEDHLLTAHSSTVISLPNSGLDVMIDHNQFDDLARLYRLFIMVPSGLPCLRKALKESVASRGRGVNKASSDPTDIATDTGQGKASGGGKPRIATSAAQTLSLALKWVQDILDLKDHFDQILIRSFKSDREIESALNEVFESVVNSNERCSEFISLFIDDHLKRGLKGKSDTEIDAVLDKTITIFRYVADKDVFERYYKGHLAKRLLHGRSVSDDAERGMLAKLKVECGYQFTHKLEGMFHDMKLSDDTMQAYRTHLEQSNPPDVPISVTVMTSSVWPVTQPNVSCSLPPALGKSCKSFEQFYLSRHSGRRLIWQMSLGNADVKVAFKNRTHELNVSTFALVTLLLFEDLPADEFLTYSEIREATSIEDSELKRHLQSLACAKYKVLKKHPPGREIEETDSFSFNEDFSANLQKIKISTVVSKVETAEERKATKGHVDEERRHQIEACIVRIMKDRKHMTHNDLVHQVARQLSARFAPEPADIKKRIEGLIEREYLERCNDRKSYNYLA